MSPLFPAGFDAKNRELRRAQSNEEQYDKIAGGLQGLDDVGFGFDPAIGKSLPVREHCFKGKRHSPFHDQSDKCLYARLR